MSAGTVAIAPFDNRSGDPSREYFARGFVEDVATELSRFGTVEVLHPRAVAAALGGPGASHGGALVAAFASASCALTGDTAGAGRYPLIFLDDFHSPARSGCRSVPKARASSTPPMRSRPCCRTSGSMRSRGRRTRE
jgi:hypothetical protein